MSLSRKWRCLFSQSKKIKACLPIIIIAFLDIPGVTSWYYPLFTSVFISERRLERSPSSLVPWTCLHSVCVTSSLQVSTNTFVKPSGHRLFVNNSDNAFHFQIIISVIYCMLDTVTKAIIATSHASSYFVLRRGRHWYASSLMLRIRYCCSHLTDKETESLSG